LLRRCLPRLPARPAGGCAVAATCAAQPLCVLSGCLGMGPSSSRVAAVTVLQAGDDNQHDTGARGAHVLCACLGTAVIDASLGSPEEMTRVRSPGLESLVRAAPIDAHQACRAPIPDRSERGIMGPARRSRHAACRARLRRSRPHARRCARPADDRGDEQIPRGQPPDARLRNHGRTVATMPEQARDHRGRRDPLACRPLPTGWPIPVAGLQSDSISASTV
jgi:hypothetical protein